MCAKMNLTHWGRVTHICVCKLTIIGSDNGLSPGRRQAIIQTNAGILLIETLGTNFNEILIDIHIFSFKKIHFKMSSGKWQPSCLGLNVLTWHLTHNFLGLHTACNDRLWLHVHSWGKGLRRCGWREDGVDASGWFDGVQLLVVNTDGKQDGAKTWGTPRIRGPYTGTQNMISVGC